LRDAWSPAEKAVARCAYDEAFEAAKAGIMAEVKRQAAAAETMADIWAIEGTLKDARRDIDLMFDYRYSQLLFVFAGLIRHGYIDEDRLDGLAEDKRETIRSILADGARLDGGYGVGQWRERRSSRPLPWPTVVPGSTPAPCANWPATGAFSAARTISALVR
jgi:hypothetical protein